MHDVVGLIGRRTDEIVTALRAVPDDELHAPSLLPGWSRLTIACHLRYGARALTWMTDAALAGEPASYYPEGRATERPGTLLPEPGESPGEVVAGLAEAADRLQRRWEARTAEQWHLDVDEPPDNPDLGTLSLGTFAALRLTEVEVHGTDLGLGLADWDPWFVQHGLTFRMARLGRLRILDAPRQAWLLRAEHPMFGLRIVAEAGTVHAEVDTEARQGDQVIRLASDRDRLALLLGRPLLEPSPDAEAVEEFRSAVPGP